LLKTTRPSTIHIEHTAAFRLQQWSSERATVLRYAKLPIV
jgi:hypothetical protein